MKINSGYRIANCSRASSLLNKTVLIKKLNIIAAMSPRNMQFLLLADHTPEMCPLTNSKVRKHVQKRVPEWRNMARELGMEFLAGPLVNNEHMVICVVEASDAELVGEFVNQSGMQQWNNVKVIPSTPIEDAIKRYDTVDPLL